MRTIAMIGLGVFGFVLVNKYFTIMAKAQGLHRRGLTAPGFWDTSAPGNELGCDFEEMTLTELRKRGCISSPKKMVH